MPPMDFEDLIIERRDHVAVITFNRPEKLNAFRNSTNLELLRALSEIDADEAVHAVIITGKGKSFCTGHDLNEPPQAPAVRISRHSSGRKYLEICEALLHLRQPIVAAINGWCAAGGLGFALCCDILIASDDAQFYNPQIAYGYPSLPGIGALLYRFTSMANTKDMILARRKVDASTAERMGIVSRVVPKAHLMNEAWDVAAKIAEVPPDIMAMQREMMNRVWLAVSGTELSLISGSHTAVAGHSLPDWQEKEADWKSTTARDVVAK